MPVKQSAHTAVSNRPADRKSTVPAADNILGAETSALTALNQALKGIEALSTVVGLLQTAAVEFVAARDAATDAIDLDKQQALAAIQLEKSGALQALRTALPNIAQLVKDAVDILFGKDKGL